MDKLRWLVLGTALTVAVTAGYFALHTVHQESVNPDAGPLLAAHLYDVTDIWQPLAQWNGKPRAIQFWATWCRPCQQQADRERRWPGPASACATRINIALDDRAHVLPFLHEHPLNGPVLFADIETFNALRALGDRSASLPFTAILSAQGKVVATWQGPVDPSWLDAQCLRAAGATGH